MAWAFRETETTTTTGIAGELATCREAIKYVIGELIFVRDSRLDIMLSKDWCKNVLDGITKCLLGYTPDALREDENHAHNEVTI